MHAAGERLKRLGRFADMRQAERDVGQEPVASLCQKHLTVTSPEELDAELVFQAANCVGDGGLRHAELAARRRVTQQPAGGLEDDQVAGRRQEMTKASHKQSLYKR